MLSIDAIATTMGPPTTGESTNRPRVVQVAIKALDQEVEAEFKSIIGVASRQGIGHRDDTREAVWRQQPEVLADVTSVPVEVDAGFCPGIVDRSLERISVDVPLQQIEEMHAAVFRRRPSQMFVKAIARSTPNDDGAALVTVGGLGAVGQTGLPEFDKFQTFTFVCRDGRWQCAAFHNTRMSEVAGR